MKSYLFVNQNNGHERTYHPFMLNSTITQEKCDELFKKNKHYHMFLRMGMNFNQFAEILCDAGYSVSIYQCPCCKNKLNYLPEVNESAWDLIEGLSGNY